MSTSDDHGQKHAAGVGAWIDRHYSYPNIVSAREGQKVLSPMDICLVRGTVGGVMGGALGVGFGLIMHMSGPMGGMGAMPPIPGQPQINVVHPPAPAMGRLGASTVAAAPGAPLASAGAHVSAASASAAAPALPATAVRSMAASAVPLGASGVSVAMPLPAASVSAAGAGAVPSLSVAAASSFGPQPRPVPIMPTGLGVPDPIYGQSHVPQLDGGWQQVKTMARDTGRMARGNFKTWGILSGTYASSECLIEKYRGRSDEFNPLLAGCTTGAILAYRAGPQGMAIGCASFAAFSYAMEQVMHGFM
jgi:import inner membrane translocase subunit TIM22